MLAVADHIDSGLGLVMDRNTDGIILRLLQQLTIEKPRRTLAMDLFASGIQRELLLQPRRLGQATHDRGHEGSTRHLHWRYIL